MREIIEDSKELEKNRGRERVKICKKENPIKIEIKNMKREQKRQNMKFENKTKSEKEMTNKKERRNHEKGEKELKNINQISTIKSHCAVLKQQF